MILLKNPEVCPEKTGGLKQKSMQSNDVNLKRNRLNDFPELQVGFPERNDASNPNSEMERIHVDFETLGISKKSAAEIIREIRGTNVPQA